MATGVTIKTRRSTAAEWAAANPILAAGEQGYETDTEVLKIGDGVTDYNSLSTRVPTPYKTTRSATLTIAASDSSAKSKAQADYVCDGVNDQIKIQAAIDTLPTVGGTVKLLEGTYNLNALTNFYLNTINKCAIIVNRNHITLEGSNGTVLKFKNGINVGDGAADTYLAMICVSADNVKINDIRFDNNNSNVTTFYNISIWTGNDTGTITNLSSHVDVSRCYFSQMSYAFWGDGGSSFWDVHHNTVVPIETGGGISCHNNLFKSSIANNKIANSTYFEVGIFLDSVDHVQVTGNYIQNPKTNGIEIYDDVNYCIISGNTINDGYGDTPRGITAHDKGDEASSNNYNIIQGNTFVNISRGIATTSYTKYTSIKDNVFVNVATPINDIGVGTIIQNNTGYVTEATGTATITAGQTSVTVTHGLAKSATHVQLTPTTATSGKPYHSSAKTATTFTITIDSAAASDISFDWFAVI